MARRLTTIVVTDIVDYSRLMADDETKTLAAVKAHQQQIIAPLIESCGGRVVKLMGDGSLLEFASVVDSVRFAVLMQRAIAEATQPMAYRIGINIGDVIADGDDIFGDGVNIAARLEPLADPGGICIARSAHSQILGKLDLDLQAMGAHEVKNIPKPIEVWRVVMNDKAALIERPTHLPNKLPDKSIRAPSARPRWLWTITSAAVLLILVAGVSWWHSKSVPTYSTTEKPSIAVLPFDNLNADKEQDYFADGIADDLITDLSKISGLFVTARNSSFSFKDEPFDLQKIAADLGVRYLLEGSIRRSVQRIRINARLIDSSTGQHIWSERYDRKLTDVFAIQDEVTKSIVTQLRVNLTSIETVAVTTPSASNIDAYDSFLRGQSLVARFNPEDNISGREMYEKAAVLDPGYARAHAGIALTHWYDVNFLWTQDRRTSIEAGIASAQRAVELDALSSHAHIALASLYLGQYRYEEAVDAAEKALELAPSYADAYAQSAAIFSNVGLHEKALEYIRIGKRLNPHFSYIYLYVEAVPLFFQHKFDEALPLIEEGVRRNPEFDRMQLLLASTLGHLGRLEAAEWALMEAATLLPTLSLEKELEDHPFAKRKDRELYVEGLKKAGIDDILD